MTATSLALGLAACQSPGTETQKPHTGIIKTPFGAVEGQPVELYTLTNSNGTAVSITTYGGIITAFRTKDKNDSVSSIVVGFDTITQYLQQPPYFGAIIGRYGNRIGNAAFSLDGKEYKLAANNGKNHLHGGLKGFDKQIWKAADVQDSVPTLILEYTSKDGEEGYPGNLQVKVTYALGDNDDLRITYDATTDKATPVNLTNHSYFNLTGDTRSTILDHRLQLKSSSYTPVDSGLIPTGEIRKVAGTPFDFSQAATVGSRMDQVPGGYDHNWVIDRKGKNLETVAILTDSVSGRLLEVQTTEPGIQFYAGNFLDGKFTNHTGTPVNLHTALCLETQHFPDSPNKKDFPTTILQPGEKYHTVTVYRVGRMAK
ncbi:aldose 1-epimerase [Flavihumibacter petaseus NBRC 106054]|uniref:Aldose 1-epimerase n=2 Tax=Flavihumibacter TaxID=1004301 RepID=A0A0E9MY78_9BACT|nr:aldose 1-epimerase [Flavihumibacter petaseus NBRC 106054]